MKKPVTPFRFSKRREGSRIATRIIDLARGDVVDAAALRDRVVAESRMSE
jgi:hypothetical protein